jgi:O-acetyl-ADP-ribose deacetylase (regulator of RNase III)
MIRYTAGDLFDARTEAIVNTVNTIGVMGKGIALQFKQRFPENYEAYRNACEHNDLKVGQLLITQSSSLFFRYIVNFPTKTHWKYPSKYEYIENGLRELRAKIAELNIKSIAIPPLGAGNGKLDWDRVKPIIERYLSDLNEVEVVVYEPQAIFEARDARPTTTAKLTPIRAMLLSLFYRYERVDGSLNLLVTQKIAYFLQRFGEPLRLEYTKGWYGPYATNLNKVLQAINGTYIQYEAQYDKPATKVNICDGKLMDIQQELGKLTDEQAARCKALEGFMEGFETPFSLELLATVDWILLQQPNLKPAEVHGEIGHWTKRKSELIKPHHVAVAYNHLMQYGNTLYTKQILL